MNHLFIMNQKITMMAISFKINIMVYTFIIASLLFIVLVLLF